MLHRAEGKQNRLRFVFVKAFVTSSSSACAISASKSLNAS
jgi:hypothetical protein